MTRTLWKLALEKLFGPAQFDRIKVEPEVVEDICSLARGSHPKEMVAFLTGSIQKEENRKGKRKERVRVLTIDGLYVKGYDASNDSTSFTTHDLPMDNVYGTVHSHPGFSNRPSMADRRLFSRYGWFHLIICQPYTKEAIRTYDKHGEPMEIAL